MSVRVEFRWPEALVGAVDAVRGDVPRAAWVRRVVEAEVGVTRLPDERRPVFVSPEVREESAASAEQPEMDGVPFTDPSDRLRETRPRVPRVPRVSPSGPVSPRVPFRRDVKSFQRGDK